MFKKNKGWILLLSLFLCLLFIVGCNNKVSEPVKEEKEEDVAPVEEQAETSEFPRTITHFSGETLISEKPVKIVTVFFPYTDHLFALETAPYAAEGQRYIADFSVYQDYLKKFEIIDLGDEVNMEALLAAEPDVIITTNFKAEMYEQFSKIAPTVALEYSNDWRVSLKQVGEIIGEDEKAEAFVNDYNAKVSTLKEALKEKGLDDNTAIFMMANDKGFHAYGGDRLRSYYEGLGLKYIEGLEEGGDLTLESISQHNPDLIFVAEKYGDPNKNRIKDLESNPVWTSLTAVENGNVFVVDASILGPLALGQLHGIEEIERYLIK